MKNIFKLLIAMGGLLTILMACEDKSIPQPADWLAKIGDRHITKSELSAHISTTIDEKFIPERGTEGWLSLEKATLDEMIRHALLVLEAQRRNIVVPADQLEQEVQDMLSDSQKDSNIQHEINDKIRKAIEERLLVERLLHQDIYSRILLKEDEIVASYEANPEKYKLPERVRVHQIVVKTEEEATDARRRLFRGEPFHKVAREMSIMPERERGGDLGWVYRGRMPKPFDDLVFSLSRHTISKPVQTDYGYHVFLITDYKPESIQKLEDVRVQIEKELLEEKKRAAEDALLDTLKKRYPVSVNLAAMQRKDKI